MVQRIKACTILSPKWNIYTAPSSLGSVIIWRGTRETSRDRGGEWIQENNVLCSQQGSCSYGLEAVMISSMKAQFQHGEERWVRSPTPSQELLAIHSCWGRKSFLSWGVLPWMGGKKKRTQVLWVGEWGESGRRWGIGWLWPKLIVSIQTRPLGPGP